MPTRLQRLRQVVWSGVLFVLVALACATPAAGRPAPERTSGLEIASAALGETRRVEVTLPSSYAWAADRRYPVLYLLDGQTHAGHAIARPLARDRARGAARLYPVQALVMAATLGPDAAPNGD